MSFIGIVAGKKNYEIIRKKIEEQIINENITFVPINLRSLENIKNIRFEVIVIEDDIKKFKDKEHILEKLCVNTSYVVINTDKNLDLRQIGGAKKVTYGLNQKAMVTVSSITDTGILIYWQESLQNREKRDIEIEERRVKKQEKSLLKTYDILIIYIILKLYDKTIIEEM